MSKNVPWSINAVEPHTWDTAREAARRSGLSVGEWLEAAIRGSAGEREFSRASATRGDSRLQNQLDDISERLDRMMDREQPRGGSRSGRGEAVIVSSIDALTDRIDSLIGEIRADDQGAPYQIKTAIDRLDSRLESVFTQNRNSSAREPDIERRLSEIAQQIGSMDRRIEQENARYVASPRTAPSIAELDSAIAEITVRQAALDDGAHSRDLDRRLAAIDQRFGFAPRSDVQLAGIEQQIKSLADEMQALRRAGTHSDAVDQLRREVGDLARMLGDLTPRRSIDALERTVAGLARRIDRSAFSERGEDNGEVVHALQEIHRSLAEVKPAESFSAVERDLKSLSEKLDSLNERGIDSTTVGRLQSQTSEIRELLANALPGDALKTLVSQIEAVMHRLEHAPSPNEGALFDVVSSLERRIDNFAERVENANRQPSTSPLLDEIKNRLEQIEDALSRGDRGAPGGLEATMKSLLDKLDAAESRLSRIGSLEHGINDLTGQMKEIRANALDVVERANRTNEPFGQIPSKTPEPREPAPVTRVEPRALVATRDPEPMKQAVSAASSSRSEPRSIALDPETATVSSSGEGDYPLEPGSGSPRNRPVQSAVERVAMSEAALGGMPMRAADHGSTADYIAAARRAAQAAAAKQPETSSAAAKSKKAMSLFAGQRRSVMLGLLFIAMTFGAVRYTGLGHMLPFIGGSELKPEPLTKPMRITPPDSEDRGDIAVPDMPAAAEQSAPQGAPASEEPAKAAPDKQSMAPTPNNLTAANTAPKMVAPNLTASLLTANIDPVTTGSVPETKQPAAKSPNKAIAPTPAASTKHAELPPSIGATGLRMAALAGDPAAAYEIGDRWFEGRGVAASTAEAKQWFEFAYAEGSIPAAYRIGNIYEKGFGTPKNLDDARRYYTIAAEAGNAKAMHNLAVLAAEGGDGKPDYYAASRWFRMAADRNVRDSQYNLGVLYARGAGVEKNFAESYRWFALAGAQGDEDAIKKRDSIAKHLDAQALATVKIAVQEWKAVPLNEAANEVKPKAEWDKAEAPRPSARKKVAKR
jgi:localization factor PodJL